MTNSILHEKKAQDWMLGALAVALFVSPWAFGFTDARAEWCAWICGVLLAYFAAASLFDASLLAGAQWEEWVTTALGLWLVVAPWVLGFSRSAGTERVYWVIGAMTVVVSLWAEWTFRHPQHSARH